MTPQKDNQEAEHLSLKVQEETGEFVIVGGPDDVTDHNCDEMQCSSIEHFLFRGRIPYWPAWVDPDWGNEAEMVA